MKAKTFSVIAGSAACNARCPFCVSKMTPLQGMALQAPKVNWHNFDTAALLAKNARVDTAMITGKGEPTLFPDQVTDYLKHLYPYQFPLIELQTNGIPLAKQDPKTGLYLAEWYGLRLSTVALSIVHYDAEINRQTYLPYLKSYIDLPELIKKLHTVDGDYGFSVRLACVLFDGGIDSASELERLVNFAKENKVEQLTIRPVNKPRESITQSVHDWVSEHYLKPGQILEMQTYLERMGTPLLDFAYGGKVYDVNSQNVCLTNSLTKSDSTENIRQIIFFPEGHIKYEWEYPGAVIL